MAQFDFRNLSSPLPGSELIDDVLEPWRDALNSLHSGPSRPSYATPGMLWINNSGATWFLNVFDGVQDIPLGTINTSTNQFTPSGLAACIMAVNNLSDLADAAIARTNLGLGALATKNKVSQGDLDAGISFMPPGAVLSFAMDAAPNGWLELDGSEKSRSAYSALFAAIGTRFGAGDGSSTFNLPPQPDFIRGWDRNGTLDRSQVIGSLTSGSPTVTITDLRGQLIYVGMKIAGTGIPAGATITAYNSGAGTLTMSANATASSTNLVLTLSSRLFGSVEADDFRSHAHQQYMLAGTGGVYGPADAGGKNGRSFGYFTDATGGPETRPRNIAMLYCIKT